MIVILRTETISFFGYLTADLKVAKTTGWGPETSLTTAAEGDMTGPTSPMLGGAVGAWGVAGEEEEGVEEACRGGHSAPVEGPMVEAGGTGRAALREGSDGEHPTVVAGE